MDIVAALLVLAAAVGGCFLNSRVRHIRRCARRYERWNRWSRYKVSRRQVVFEARRLNSDPNQNMYRYKILIAQHLPAWKLGIDVAGSGQRILAVPFASVLQEPGGPSYLVIVAVSQGTLTGAIHFICVSPLSRGDRSAIFGTTWSRINCRIGGRVVIYPGRISKDRRRHFDIPCVVNGKRWRVSGELGQWDNRKFKFFTHTSSGRGRVPVVRLKWRKSRASGARP